MAAGDLRRRHSSRTHQRDSQRRPPVDPIDGTSLYIFIYYVVLLLLYIPSCIWATTYVHRSLSFLYSLSHFILFIPFFFFSRISLSLLCCTAFKKVCIGVITSLYRQAAGEPRLLLSFFEWCVFIFCICCMPLL